MVAVMKRRTSLLIRLSREDAARIHEEASSEYRSLSGYLLRKLGISFRIEGTLPVGFAKSLLEKQARAVIGPQDKKLRIAVHLRCTVEEAETIRACAARRELSIGDFVVFSLRRSWAGLARLHER